MTDEEQFKFASDLAKKLKDTPSELQIPVYKSTLNNISDLKERSKVENIVDMMIKINTPSNVVVLIHGIRTYAPWQELLKSELDKHGVKSYPIGYGYFDSFRFWFPYFFRQGPIEKITQELRNIQAKYPTDNIIVIAHSFGTYVISKILLNSPDVKINRLLLCGSIIKNSFRWDKLPKIPRGGIINDCGLKDIWPLLAKSLSWGYGSTGRFGFKSSEVTDRYHDFGHSDFFDHEFMQKFWIPFILHGQPVKSEKKPISSGWLIPFDILPISTICLICLPIINYRHELLAILKNFILNLN